MCKVMLMHAWMCAGALGFKALILTFFVHVQICISFVRVPACMLERVFLCVLVAEVG